MIESFVDLTYRGLSLGRRIKLTQVRPTSGTLELVSPMPVGTPGGDVQAPAMMQVLLGRDPAEAARTRRIVVSLAEPKRFDVGAT